MGIYSYQWQVFNYKVTAINLQLVDFWDEVVESIRMMQKTVTDAFLARCAYSGVRICTSKNRSLFAEFYS